MSTSEVLSPFLVGLDTDLIEYIMSSVDNMTLEEKRSSSSLNDVISPFLIESELMTPEAAEELCKSISVSFGGSGYKTLGNQVKSEDTLTLLHTPMRIIDHSYLPPPKATYGGAVMLDANSDDTNVKKPMSNQLMDISNIPTTQKELRRKRRENEQLQKILRAEVRANEKRREEMATARMEAIKAARKAGMATNVGVKIERFSLPHPSGTGDILTDAALTLSPGRRYGLIGKNGAGKSTLMRAIANYQLEGLLHLKILLVDQHVEGDARTPLQVPRVDSTTHFIFGEKSYGH